MKILQTHWLFVFMLAILAFGPPAWSDRDLPTKFLNRDGVVNTRHNLSQSTIGSGSVTMNPYRNDYGAVCVYCHTPHGANSSIDAPKIVRSNDASASRRQQSP